MVELIIIGNNLNLLDGPYVWAFYNTLVYVHAQVLSPILVECAAGTKGMNNG